MERQTLDLLNSALEAVRCDLAPRVQELALTAEGRTTVDLLDMNGEDRLQLRYALVRRGWSP